MRTTASTSTGPTDTASFIPGTGTSAQAPQRVLPQPRHTRREPGASACGLPSFAGLRHGHGGAPRRRAHGHHGRARTCGATCSRPRPRLPGARSRWRRGIYPSHIGFESLQSQLNWTYTRSWMGELCALLPDAASRAPGASMTQWSAQLHLINGWQNISENNHGKALGTQVAYAGERLARPPSTPSIGEEGGRGHVTACASSVTPWPLTR